MLLGLLLSLLGVAMLYAGAEWLVKGSVSLGARVGLSPLVIGITIVAFGTSSPELVVSVLAALAGNGGIAVGNVVGSNIANVALILGLCALIRPIAIEPRLVRLDLPLLLAVSVLGGAFLTNAAVSRLEGFLLFALLLAFMVISVREHRRTAVVPPDPDSTPGPLSSRRRLAALVIGGLVVLAAGAGLLVRGATGIAASLGATETVIGLTIVALGTSLPELATSAVAAARGQGGLAVGNVIGSNIFNLLGILGLSALIRPLASPGLGILDIGSMILAVALLLPLAVTGNRLNRTEGGVLLAGYAAYLVLVILR